VFLVLILASCQKEGPIEQATTAVHTVRLDEITFQKADTRPSPDEIQRPAPIRYQLNDFETRQYGWAFFTGDTCTGVVIEGKLTWRGFVPIKRLPFFRIYYAGWISIGGCAFLEQKGRVGIFRPMGDSLLSEIKPNEELDWQVVVRRKFYCPEQQFDHRTVWRDVERMK
jgi:hypothetical protein